MPVFNPQLLQAWTSGSWNNLPTAPITGFMYDTRQLKPGALFVALTCGKQDGHAFLEHAYQAGASAALVESFVSTIPLPQLRVQNTLQAFQAIAAEHRKQFAGTLITISGSCGKTTTKDLLHAFVGKETTHATFHNFNNFLGVPLTVLGLDPAKHTAAVIEVGISEVGEMQPLADLLKPDLTLITSIAPTHLEGMEDLDTIALEKSLLAKAALPNGQAIIGSTCLHYAPFKALEKNLIAVYPKNGYTCKKVNFNACYSLESKNPTQLLLKLEGHLNADEHLKESYTIPSVSKGQASNFALAITAARLLGINESQIQLQAQAWKPSAYRGEIRYSQNQIWYADCYNASPDAFVDALEHFQSLFTGDTARLYVVAGMKSLGKHSFFYHSVVGKALQLRPQDKAILIGKEAEAIAETLLKVGVSKSQLHSVQAKDEARHLIEPFQGAIFIKGGNMYQLWELLPQ